MLIYSAKNDRMKLRKLDLGKWRKSRHELETVVSF